MRNNIDVEVCNAEFKHKNLIHFIRCLDNARATLNTKDGGCNMKYESIKGEMVNNEFGLFYNQIKVIDKPITVDIGKKLEFNKVLKLDYVEMKEIYNDTRISDGVNLDQFVNMISNNFNIFEITLQPHYTNPTPVVARVDGVLYNIKYDQLIVSIITFISCIKSDHVLHYEIIPNTDKNSSQVTLRVRLDTKKIRNRGILGVSVDPYFRITGTRRNLKR